MTELHSISVGELRADILYWMCGAFFVLETDRQMFIIPAPTLCPMCKEKIDLDRAVEVGPRYSEHAGKPLHRLCLLKLIQGQRNEELREVTILGKKGE